MARLSVLALTAVAAAATFNGKLHLFDTTRFPDAVCNDGTPSGIYFQPSPSGSNTWIIHQQGGGWCYDQPSCEARTGNLISSKGWGATMSVSGLFNSTDARFRDANLVYLPYCTSDAYIGSMPASAQPWGWAFQGRAVVHAAFATAAALGMGTQPGTSVLYSGCSAGARGVLFNSGYVATQLLPSLFPSGGPGSLARYGSLLDSAFWIDMAPINASFPSFGYEVQQVYTMVNASGNIDANCSAVYAGGEGWKCLMGQYAVAPLTASGIPYFLHSYQYDLYQLQHDLGVPAPATPAQLSYCEGFRTATRAAAAADTLSPAAPGTAAMLPACFKHCNTETSTWTTLLTDGYSLEQAVLSWFYSLGSDGDATSAATSAGATAGAGATTATTVGLAAGAVPQYIVDNCKGFNCGTGCPTPPQWAE